MAGVQLQRRVPRGWVDVPDALQETEQEEPPHSAARQPRAPGQQRQAERVPGVELEVEGARKGDANQVRLKQEQSGGSGRGGAQRGSLAPAQPAQRGAGQRGQPTGGRQPAQVGKGEQRGCVRQQQAPGQSGGPELLRAEALEVDGPLLVEAAAKLKGAAQVGGWMGSQEGGGEQQLRGRVSMLSRGVRTQGGVPAGRLRARRRRGCGGWGR